MIGDLTVSKVVVPKWQSAFGMREVLKMPIYNKGSFKCVSAGLGKATEIIEDPVWKFMFRDMPASYMPDFSPATLSKITMS